ncbi:sensor histidine kinase [Pontibacter ruber]|uniref:histidine kinase n=1 Tax=Pontibacter ruber TaxID=1343895 RepID=A0ABW5CZ95_9BACT|nr:ATP-binding protein [Pontibacter ruber]
MIGILQPLLIITPVLLVLAVGIILFVFKYQRRMLLHQDHLQQLQASQQHQLLEAALEAQEVERRRVARDLHDEIGGMLSLVRLNISQLGKQNSPPEATGEVVQNAKVLLDDVIGNIRRISHDLMPVVLEKVGLVQALEALKYSIPPAAHITLKLTTDLEGVQLDKKQQLLLYRIVQELLNNTLKHAGATEITLSVLHQGGKVKLAYADNGKGFEYKAGADGGAGGALGLGLTNLQSRVRLLKGTLTYFSAPGAGTNAEILLTIS